MQGIVYLLRNEAMPGLVKIGLTTSDLLVRIRQLNNTSVPFDFECFYAARVADCAKVERLLHSVFDDKRVNPRREFFLVDEAQAIAAVQLAELEVVTPAREEVMPDPAERAAADEMARRRRKTTLFDVGFENGTELQLRQDPAITCIVRGPREVEFEGQRLSPSAAALRAINQRGSNWSAANGWQEWTFEGRPLVDYVSEHLLRAEAE